MRSGSGGAGVSHSMPGSVQRGRGGAGGISPNPYSWLVQPGSAGAGGGGAGGSGTSTTPAAAAANLSGGGGGAGGVGSQNGAAGGSGTVIIRYQYQ